MFKNFEGPIANLTTANSHSLTIQHMCKIIILIYWSILNDEITTVFSQAALVMQITVLHLEQNAK